MSTKKSKLAIIKTKQTELSVDDFINSIPDIEKQKDSLLLVKMMTVVTKEKPILWGTSIIGFGQKIYKSPATGREVAWFLIGFSPRKANISLHLVLDIKKHAITLKKLGKHKTGVGCLYINKLEEVDLKVLKGLIELAVKQK